MKIWNPAQNGSFNSSKRSYCPEQVSLSRENGHGAAIKREGAASPRNFHNYSTGNHGEDIPTPPASPDPLDSGSNGVIGYVEMNGATTHRYGFTQPYGFNGHAYPPPPPTQYDGKWGASSFRSARDESFDRSRDHCTDFPRSRDLAKRNSRDEPIDHLTPKPPSVKLERITDDADPFSRGNSFSTRYATCERKYVT